MSIDYTVHQGDCISSIANQFGFFEDTIWYHEANAELRQIRPDPNVLQPGDIVSIPDRSPKQESCGTDQRHRFVRKGIPVMLDIQLFDEDEPRSNLPFTVVVEGQYLEGSTDGEGRIRIGIPPGARNAELRLENDAPILLNLGEMDSDDTIEGLQARLHNLGFYGGSQ